MSNFDGMVRVKNFDIFVNSRIFYYKQEELRTVFNNTKINLLDPSDFQALNSGTYIQSLYLTVEY